MDNVTTAGRPQEAVLITILKWIGVTSIILGTALTSLDIAQWAVVSFTVGSAAWLYVGIHWRERSLWMLNGILLCVNMFGLYRVFLV